MSGENGFAMRCVKCKAPKVPDGMRWCAACRRKGRQKTYGQRQADQVAYTTSRRLAKLGSVTSRIPDGYRNHHLGRMLSEMVRIHGNLWRLTVRNQPVKQTPGQLLSALEDGSCERCGLVESIGRPQEVCRRCGGSLIRSDDWKNLTEAQRAEYESRAEAYLEVGRPLA